MARPLVLLFLLFGPLQRLAAADLATGSAPSWVERTAVDLSGAPQRDVRWGIYALLDDHQVRAAGGTVEFNRHVRKVISPSGVQNASELEFDFDPTYQRLVIHEIVVIRGGTRIRALDPASIRVIEKEDGSGSHLYDGMQTAVAFVNDVRPGDVLDYSWSLEGANPLLGGRFADTFDMTSDMPARRIRHRLLLPAGRTIHYRSSLPVSSAADAVHFTAEEAPGGEKAYVWERRDVPPIDTDDQTPDWFDPYDHVQVSEFASWSEVALWADAMFRMNDRSRAAVSTLAATIRREHPVPREQVAAAIRFVQDDIRYLGIEMGRNSHEPHQPANVLDQRWGDCKDKSFLLAALLRELGAEAWPALVNTRLRHSMDRVLPSPFEFDHVITQVVWGGKSRWVDPTLADQGGTLETIETPNDERALVIRKETTALTPIVTKEKGATSIELAYATKLWAGPTSVHVKSTYTGGDADLFRAEMASQSVADLARDRVNRLASSHPKIRAASSPEISDDRTRNVIMVRERYVVDDLWNEGHLTYLSRSIEDHLPRPQTVLRSAPLAFDYPLDLSVRASFDLPGAVTVEERDTAEEGPAFRYESHVSRSGNSVMILQSLRSKRDSIEAAAIADHLTRLNSIRAGAAVTLTRRTTPLLASAAGLPAAAWAATIAAALAAGFLLGRRAAGRL